jgi:hypothetical protein
MRKLTPEETPDLLPIKRGSSKQLRLMLLQLAIGDVVFMPREEWKRKDSPSFIISYIKKTHGFRYDYGMKSDDTGWLFR